MTTRKALFRKARRLEASVRTLVVANDVRRWSGTARSVPAWDDRNRMIGQLIPPGVSVLDVGSGAQTLRAHLPPTCQYQAADLIPGPGVLRCDLNHGKLPQIRARFDYVVLSGVLEYITKPVAAIQGLRPLAAHLIVSYAVRRPDDSRVARLAMGWRNHLTRAELLALLDGLDLPRWCLGTWHGQEVYYVYLDGVCDTAAGPQETTAPAVEMSDIDEWIQEGREAVEQRNAANDSLKRLRPLLLALRQAEKVSPEQEEAIEGLFPQPSAAEQSRK